jgi:hypothetical protein
VVHQVPGRCDVTGPGAGTAVTHGPQPGLDVLADAGGEAVELAFQPPFEGGTAVIGQHAHLLEHLGDPFDADVPGPQCREDLGVADLVAGHVPGQHDDEGPADPEPQSSSPAASLAAAVGEIQSPGQPRVAEVGVGALIDPGEVPAGLEQPRLDPAAGRADRGGRRGLARSTAAAVLVNRAFGPAALHPVEEQLVLAQPLAGLQDRDRASRQAPRELGLMAGLLPAQPASPGPGAIEITGTSGNSGVIY